MQNRNATASWQGTLSDGHGSMKLGSGLFEGAFSAGTRFEQEAGTNPEELIAAAHAGCFSMAFAHMLNEAGYDPKEINTEASVELKQVDEGFAITLITLKTDAKVGGIDEDAFQKVANEAKTGCPVSKALAGAEIQLEANLTS